MRNDTLLDLKDFYDVFPGLEIEMEDRLLLLDV